MTHLEIMSAVWENPEKAYQDYLTRNGNLTRKEFVEKIAFIQNGKQNISLLHGILGNEVASYSPEEYEEMDMLKGVITSVANFLLTGDTGRISSLEDIVARALQTAVADTIAQNASSVERCIKNFSIEDCYLIKPGENTNNLKAMLFNGVYDTVVFCDDTGVQCQTQGGELSDSYVYLADKRDKSLFVAFYENDLITKDSFNDKIYRFLVGKDEAQNDGSIVFVDDSMYTKQGTDIHLQEIIFSFNKSEEFNFDGISGVHKELVGKYQKEHIVFFER